MAKTGNLTPAVLVSKLRENMNNNGTLKAQFRHHFLSKLTENELDGIKSGIEAETERRKQAIVDEKINYLKEMGYNVSK